MTSMDRNIRRGLGKLSLSKRTREKSQDTTELTDSFRRLASQNARTTTAEKFQNSQFGQRVRELPTFDGHEIILGKRLGKGGFSDVDEIRGIVLKDKKSSPNNAMPKFTSMLPPKIVRSDSVAFNDKESRQFIADHCFRRSGDARYAIKKLRRDTLKSEETVELALSDLAIETRFLSSLEHPNVIKIRATSRADPFTRDYFLILDRLYDTLQKRIETWRGKKKRLYSIWGECRDRTRIKKMEFYESRIERAFDLGAALTYIHDQNIIHRDIKPENVGFDCRGDLKIFDFGLARELRHEDKLNDGTYKFTRMAGSLRYMAPEVYFGAPYNAGCDVYSFGIVLWEVVSLKRPFAFHNWTDESEFAVQVFDQGARPPIDTLWPIEMQKLFEYSWCTRAADRMSMAQITKTLRSELVRLRHGDESGIADHTRRRSTFIFDPKTFLKELGNSAEFLDGSVRSQVSRHSCRSGCSSNENVKNEIQNTSGSSMPIGTT